MKKFRYLQVNSTAMDKNKVPKLLLYVLILMSTLIILDNASTLFQKVIASINFAGMIYVIVATAYNLPPMIDIFKKNKKK